MKRISVVFFFLLVSTFLEAQTKNFQLLNPEAAELTKEQLEYLTTHSWKVNTVDTHIRGEIVNTKGWAFLEFRKDNKFEYGGKSGDWELIENKYFKYQLNNPEDEARLNFGGIYAVVNLTDTTLTLTKILTSTNDMRRTIYLFHSNYYKDILYTDKLVTNMERYYKGEVSKEALDSISYLSEELLLKVGFHHGFYLVGDTIFINTKDSIYKIKKNSD